MFFATLRVRVTDEYMMVHVNSEEKKICCWGWCHKTVRRLRKHTKITVVAVFFSVV